MRRKAGAQSFGSKDGFKGILRTAGLPNTPIHDGRVAEIIDNSAFCRHRQRTRGTTMNGEIIEREFCHTFESAESLFRQGTYAAKNQVKWFSSREVCVVNNKVCSQDIINGIGAGLCVEQEFPNTLG